MGGNGCGHGKSENAKSSDGGQRSDSLDGKNHFFLNIYKRDNALLKTGPIIFFFLIALMV